MAQGRFHIYLPNTKWKAKYSNSLKATAIAKMSSGQWDCTAQTEDIEIISQAKQNNTYMLELSRKMLLSHVTASRIETSPMAHFSNCVIANWTLHHFDQMFFESTHFYHL